VGKKKKGKLFSVAVVGNDLNSSELLYFIPDSKWRLIANVHIRNGHRRDISKRKNVNETGRDGVNKSFSSSRTCII